MTKRRRRSRVALSCADHACGCVYCCCQRMIENSIGFRCPQQYARFGSDVMRHGFRLPPADLAPSIAIDEAIFEDLHVELADDAVAGLSLMMMLGRFGTCSIPEPDADA